ncbi:MAG: VCBS repeat-containing protein [Planctomycetes bacterium]|nr:VCBS repeat-containing protein [Planctomycetota bacterium]
MCRSIVRCSVAAAVWLAASLGAQVQFAELSKRHLPNSSRASAINAHDTFAIAAGDVDRDGDVDLLLARSGQDRLYEGDGHGGFVDATSVRLPADADAGRAVALVDVDLDGDLDAVVAIDGQNRLLINDGTGTFADATATRLPIDADRTAGLAVGDVDGDGDPDLVLGNRGTQPTRLYLNDGNGVFVDVTATCLPADSDDTWDLRLGDVDGDGDLDLVIGNYRDQNRLYANDGAGHFTDVTAARLPADLDRTHSIGLADVDGDGDLDLAVGNSGADRLYLNDGSGTFSDQSQRLPVQSDDTAAMAFGDVDGDGDQDLVLGENYPFQMARGYPRLCLNDGQGTFTFAPEGRLPKSYDYCYALVLCDVDWDGDLDLVRGNLLDHDDLYLNDSHGTFACGTAELLPRPRSQTLALAFGDVDADGDPDLVIGADDWNRLYLNDGRGRFSDATLGSIPSRSEQSAAIALGDVDGDGDLDLVVGNDGFDYGRPAQQNRLYLNDGAGVFADVTAARLPQSLDRTRAVVLGDWDRDGDLDVVFGNLGQSIMCINDGRGHFTAAAGLPSRSDGTRALAAADFDADGDVDLVFGNEGSDRLLLNDGSGAFVDAPAGSLPASAGWSLAVAVGDVDGDGDPDLVMSRVIDLRALLLLNDGTGVFTDVTASSLPAFFDTVQAIALLDVDDDGDLDIALGNSGQDRLLVNDGRGRFADATARLAPHEAYTTAVASADVDADGDQDLVLMDRLMVNLLRQSDVPLLTRLREDLVLEIHAAPGLSTVPQLVVPNLAPAAARIPIPPYGTLGIDPALMISLPWQVVAPPGGIATIRFRVPDLPLLIGVPVFVQSVLVDPVRSVRLTNVTADVLFR